MRWAQAFVVFVQIPATQHFVFGSHHFLRQLSLVLRFIVLIGSKMHAEYDPCTISSVNSVRKAFSSGISLNLLSQPSILAKLARPHKAVNLLSTDPSHLCLKTRREFTSLKRLGFFFIKATSFLPHALCSFSLPRLTTYVLAR
jgi:hypothetical protein